MFKLAAAFTLAASLLAPIADAKPRKHKAPESAEVQAAQHRLDLDKHALKIAKLAARAAKAIEACELEVSIACEDTTERDHDGGECSDATLNAKHAFDVCTGQGPAFSSKEGK